MYYKSKLAVLALLGGLCSPVHATYMSVIPDEGSSDLIYKSVHGDLNDFAKELNHEFQNEQLISYVNDPKGNIENQLNCRQYHMSIEEYTVLCNNKPHLKTMKNAYKANMDLSSEDIEALNKINTLENKNFSEVQKKIKQLKIKNVNKYLEGYVSVLNLKQHMTRIGQVIQNNSFSLSGCQILKCSHEGEYVLALDINLKGQEAALCVNGVPHISLIKVDFSKLKEESKIKAKEILEKKACDINNYFQDNEHSVTFDKITFGTNYDFIWENETFKHNAS